MATEKKDYFVHESSYVDEGAVVGTGSKVWHYTHVMSGAKIGEKCVLGQNVNVGGRAVLGNNVRVQNNVSIYDEVYLEDDVFCGPSMVFTNVVNPRSHVTRKDEYKKTLIKRGASLGANCTVVCGNTVGEYAFVGAGAVVTKDVPAYSLVVGCPAKLVGWMCYCGVRLPIGKAPEVCSCEACERQYEVSGDGLVEVQTSKEHGPIPLLDLKAQYAPLKNDIRAAMDKVIDSQHFIMGPEVKALEEEVADYCGCKHAIGVSSGTDALLVALMALGVGPGDEVISPSYSFFATAGVVTRLGATPVFVDVAKKDFNIDCDALEAAITDKTKAIIPVHLFGQCADMDMIMRIAKSKGVAVIEDACQSLGAEWSGKRAGSMGTVGCFSFFPSKNLGCFGDGGMCVTNDDELAEQIRILRVHGGKPKYFHRVVGGNFRLDAIQAAILRVKLRHLDNWSEARAKNAAHYDELFAKAGLSEEILKTPERNGHRHVYNQYVLCVKDRDELQKHLKEKGIGTAVYYPKALHVQECFAEQGYKEGDMPVSEDLANRSVAIPVYPELSAKQRERVVEAIVSFYR